MAVDPKSLDLTLLPPEHRAAFELLLAQSERVAELEAVTARLEALIKELHQALYGKKSEKLPEDDRQLAFEDLRVAIAEAEEAKDAHLPEKPRQRAAPVQRNLGQLPEHLPRIEKVIEPKSLECPCGCGQMHKIGEDRTERLDIIPAQLRVIVTIRPKYACRACTDGITQAPSAPYLIEGGLPTEALIAHVLVAKYADHLPAYRQSQIIARSGGDLHRATLTDWIGAASFHLIPVVDLLATKLKRSGKLFMPSRQIAPQSPAG